MEIKTKWKNDDIKYNFHYLVMIMIVWNIIDWQKHFMLKLKWFMKWNFYHYMMMIKETTII